MAAGGAVVAPTLRHWICARPVDFGQHSSARRPGVVIDLGLADFLGSSARLGKLDPAGQKRLAGLQSFLEMVEKQRSQPAPKQS